MISAPGLSGLTGVSGLLESSPQAYKPKEAAAIAEPRRIFLKFMSYLCLFSMKINKNERKSKGENVFFTLKRRKMLEKGRFL
jgi:hypothetical protein